jgi:transcriptional regulator with XRE-family HTH domain
MDKHNYDNYTLVRELVRDYKLTIAEIAERTGYSKGYVGQLRQRFPSEDAQRRRLYYSNWAEEMLSILKRSKSAIEALDGTSKENERLVDDYRILMARIRSGIRG